MTDSSPHPELNGSPSSTSTMPPESTIRLLPPFSPPQTSSSMAAPTPSSAPIAIPVSSPEPPPSQLAPPTYSLLSTSPPGQPGKSGRVIEKLMAENDRLRRELKVESTAREEERKAKEAIQQSRDNLKSTNQNLIHQANIDKSLLARKERKLEELRQERDHERSVREEAEASLRVHARESGTQLQDLKSELSKETAERKRLQNEYEVLRESFKRLDTGYKTRLDRLRASVDAVTEARTRDREILRKLEVTVEQQSRELEKMREAKKKITEMCERTIMEAEGELRGIKKIARERELELGTTLEDAKETLGRMRHIIGVQKNMRPGTAGSTATTGSSA